MKKALVLSHGNAIYFIRDDYKINITIDNFVINLTEIERHYNIVIIFTKKRGEVNEKNEYQSAYCIIGLFFIIRRMWR